MCVHFDKQSSRDGTVGINCLCKPSVMPALDWFGSVFCSDKTGPVFASCVVEATGSSTTTLSLFISSLISFVVAVELAEVYK